LGIDWVYQRHQVEAHELADFVAGLDDRWRGLSCTMPLKEAVVPLGVPDEIVTALGVGNTLIFDGHPADPTTTLVRNTDVPGLESALRAAGVEHAETALLVGNGATARSSVCGVARLGVTTIYVLARDPAKTEVLARLGEQYGVTLEHLGWTVTCPRSTWPCPAHPPRPSRPSLTGSPRHRRSSSTRSTTPGPRPLQQQPSGAAVTS